MPSGSYRQVYVQCPFYTEDDGKRRLTCEGIVDKSNIIWRFRTNAGFDQQLEQFCCKDYVKCQLYQVLWDKYDEEGTE